MGFFILKKTVKYHKLSEVQFNEMHKEFAVFLATPASDFMTGQTVYAEGGLISRF